MEIPAYLPLRRESLRDFEKITSRVSSAQHSDALLSRLINQSNKYIEYSLKNKSDLQQVAHVLEENLRSMEVLVRTQYYVTVYKSSVDASRKRIRQFQAAENELTLDNIDVYQSIANDEKRENFADAIQSDYTNARALSGGSNSSLRRNEHYKKLSDLLFILKDPETQIPEADDGDDGDEQDLNLFGGKISLKDPISLNYFVDPVKSKKCKHTFEKDVIEQILRSDRNCPIDGCTAEITPGDLVPDILMKVRVQVFSQSSRLRKEANVTRLE